MEDLPRSGRPSTSLTKVNIPKVKKDVVEDLPRSGWPSTSLTEAYIVKVKEMMIENSLLSLREIAAELSVSHESIPTI